MLAIITINFISYDHLKLKIINKLSNAEYRIWLFIQLEKSKSGCLRRVYLADFSFGMRQRHGEDLRVLCNVNKYGELNLHQLPNSFQFLGFAPQWPRIHMYVLDKISRLSLNSKCWSVRMSTFIWRSYGYIPSSNRFTSLCELCKCSIGFEKKWKNLEAILMVHQCLSYYVNISKI